MLGVAVLLSTRWLGDHWQSSDQVDDLQSIRPPAIQLFMEWTRIQFHCYLVSDKGDICANRKVYLH
ncbi:MAG: hypothetical protein C4519_27300 [Desulfobacteraceae bacterium]|nr:MAG: hypothetical protein C4519_27300 [Desulfobacteraceae bacterium]